MEMVAHLSIVNSQLLLHSLWYLNTQQAHAALDDFGYVAGNDQTNLAFLLVRLVQDGVVMIELVEDLGQFIAIVGYSAG